MARINKREGSMLNWKKTAFVIQGMAGFESFLAGIFLAFQEKSILPQAVSTEGASISAAICYSADYPMKDFVSSLKEFNQYSTVPQAVLLNCYSNGVFHSTQPFEYSMETLKGSYATQFTYHFSKNDAHTQSQKNMKIPVYTSIVNLLTNESKTIDLKTFDFDKSVWLGTRIPYFKPQKINDEIYVEDHFHNPPLKPIIDHSEIENFLVIQSYPETVQEPKNLFELQDRSTDLMMNSYLNDQLKFIQKVNQWVKEGLLPMDKYKNIQLKKLMIDPGPFDYLDYTPSGLQKKFDHGYLKGKELLKDMT